MLLEKFKKMLQKKEEERSQLKAKADASNDVQELRGINTQMTNLDGEIEELRGIISEIEGNPANGAAGSNGQEGENLEQRGQNQPVGGMEIMSTYGVGQPGQVESRSMDSNDPYDTEEYRSAFMNYVLNDVESDLIRAATATSDIGPVIPTTILNKIVEKMNEYGQIFKRVTKTTIKGGVSVPKSSLKPKAYWVTGNSMANENKKGVDGHIQFGYYKLQCRAAIDLIAGTVSLPVFEKSLVDNIDEAMIIAAEEAIISGSGLGQPLGISKDDSIPAAQIIEVTEEEFGKYKTWPTLLSKMPRSYRKKMSIIMNDSDWMRDIVGMVDNNQQPVARINYGLNGEEKEILLGKEVLPVEEYLPSIVDANVGDVVGIFVDLRNYAFNSNMQMMFKSTLMKILMSGSIKRH